MARRRAHGEGTVFKQWRWLAKTTKAERAAKISKGIHGDYYIWTAEITVNGAKKRITGKRGGTQKEVKDKLLELRNDIESNVLMDKTEYTMKDYINNWYITKRDVGANTRKVYRHYIDSYIVPYIGETITQSLSINDIEVMFNKLIDHGSVKTKIINGKKVHPGLKPSVLRKVKFILSAVMEKAVEEGYAKKNLMKSIKLPRITRTTIKPLTKDEISVIFNEIKDSPVYIGLILGISTGLRRGELLGLRWSDIDLKAGIATINQQLTTVDGKAVFKDSLKTESSTRRIGIPQKVIAELELHKAMHEAKAAEYIQKCKERAKKAQEGIEDDENIKEYFDEGIVVCQSNGKHWHPRNFARNVDKTFAKAGLEQRRVHDIRHSFATQLLTSGVYANEVQAALGHADIKTTLGTYGHLLPGREMEIANKMNEIIETKNTPA